MIKKIIAGILILSLCIIYSSCTADTIDNDIETQAETTVAAEETDSTLYWDAYLPADDYDGYNFRVAVRDGDDHIAEIWSEKQSGEILNDSVYVRNAAVKEAYNIEITAAALNESSSAQLVKSSVLSGSDEYDLAALHMVEAANASLEGLFMNWLNIPHIDLDNPWWSSDVKESLVIDNKLMLTAGDYTYADLGFTMALAFNKNLIEEYSLTNPYEKVKSGDWTLDEFKNMVRGVSADLNGDSIYDVNDLYGLMMVGGASKTVLFFGAGQFITQNNSEGLPELCLNNPKTLEVFDFFYDLYFTGSNTLFFPDNDPMEKTWTVNFEEGRVLFVPLQVNAMKSLRNMKADFGMLPYPKYNAEQEKYYSMVNGHSTMMTVPITVAEPERTGIIIEALASESHRTIIPTYAEIVTKVKYSRDNDTSLMIDYILESRTYNFGYVYMGSTGIGFILTTLMDTQDNNFSSAYAKIENSTIKHFEKVISAYQNLP